MQFNMASIWAGSVWAGNSQNGSSASTENYAESNEQPTIDISQLQSDDQTELLTAIDRLRRENIDAEISIPQIVVCGDQSSGKSSVLEAIANVRFPISTKTTTRFATEVVLRQSDEIRRHVSITPWQGRPEEQKKEIKAFQPPFEDSRPEAFGRLITAAGEFLEKLDTGCKFWKDRLRVEVSGPTQPRLTLVDLPGIIQSEHGANPGDKDKIKELVLEYLGCPRTTVLAVVDAQNDTDNQEIFGLMQQSSLRDKTLGVITKPDRLAPGSDLEKIVIDLAKNKTTPLRLGWHVLKNLPHEERHRSPDQRDGSEREFFSENAWSQLKRSDVGIENLRKKLSAQLFRSISADLPDLITEMRGKLRHCQATVDRLGPGRESVAEQRIYLSNVLNKLQRLIEGAVNGDYEKTEFGSFFDGAQKKGLRDRITNESIMFASKMRVFGRQFHVHAEDVDGSKDKSRYATTHGHMIISILS